MKPSVEVTFLLNENFARFDERIEGFVKSTNLGGERWASGAGFGMREIAFETETIGDANELSDLLCAEMKDIPGFKARVATYTDVD